MIVSLPAPEAAASGGNAAAEAASGSPPSKVLLSTWLIVLPSYTDHLLLGQLVKYLSKIDSRKCQTSTATPAEPGDLPYWFRPAVDGVPSGERPTVWFSLNAYWELTANKNWTGADGTRRTLTMLETHERRGGLAGIGVAAETAPHDWNAMKELSGMSSKMAQGLYRWAIDCGAQPGEWRGTLEPVPRSKWMAAEVFNGVAWVSVLIDRDEVSTGPQV